MNTPKLITAPSTNPALKGILIPTQPKGKFDPDTRHAWITAVEQIMTAGVTDPKTISEITGLTHKRASEFVADIERAWSLSLTPAIVATRREKLYREVEHIKRECWLQYHRANQLGGDTRELGAWLKLVLETIDRQARISSLDNHTLAQPQAPVQIKIKTIEEMQSEATAMLGTPLPDSALKALADSLSSLKDEGDDE
jgi:hypothetical protein